MLTSFPSNDQLRATFDFVLARILSGDYYRCPSDTGLNIRCVELLNAIPGAADVDAAVKRARAAITATPPPDQTPAN